MKLKILYTLFIVLDIFSCVLAYFQMYSEAILALNLSLVALCIIAYVKMKFKNLLFYISMIVAAVGESFLIVGLKNYPLQIIICFTIYAWLLIFLLNKNVPKIDYSIKKSQLLPLMISSFLIVYLIMTVLGLVSAGLKEYLVYVYVFLASFFILAMYIGLIYVSGNSYRYIWLLFLMVSFLIAITASSTEAYYFPSQFLKKITCYAFFGSHFFLLKFLISPDVEISYIK